LYRAVRAGYKTMAEGRPAGCTGTLNAVARGSISLWIVGACITSEGVRTLLGVADPLALPQWFSAMLGILGMVWIFPGFWCFFVFGILGAPCSWPVLLRNALEIFPGGPAERFLGALATVYKTIVFLPFYCPKFLDEVLPTWIKFFLFRQRPEVYPPPSYQQAGAKVKDECWIFVNGIATTTQIANSNVRFLYNLFGREIHLCYNPTDGMLVDLLECAVGKVGFFDNLWVPGPRKKLIEALTEALQKAEVGIYKRVVVVAHSQGTIVTSNAVEALQGRRDDHVGYRPLMKKFLHVFAFADCAHQMDGSNLVYLENVSNRGDSVAWLCALFPFKKFWQDREGIGIRVDGSLVTEPNLWGHLLNTHYLEQFERGRYPTSRLHLFRNGRSPGRGVVAC
jgi:hypothetical protein